MSQKPSVVIAAALLLGLPAACGSDGDATDGEGGFGPLAVVEGTPSGDGALIEGELHIGDSCVTLAATDGIEWLIAWPSIGTTWDAEEQVIRYDDGHPDDDEPEIVVMTDGDTVRFGGGGFEETSSGESYDDFVASIDWRERPSEECSPTAVWFAG